MADKNFKDYFNSRTEAGSLPVNGKILIQSESDEPKRLDVELLIPDQKVPFDDFGTIAEFLTDQTNQLKGFSVFDENESIIYVYKGVANGLITDYWQLGVNSVQDKDGIEQFTGNDIKFEGFDFDAANDKIINPTEKPELYVTELLRVGKSGKDISDPYKQSLTIAQVNSIESNPPIFELYARGKGSSNGHISQIDIRVQNNVANQSVVVANFKWDEMLLNVPVKATSLSSEDLITVDRLDTGFILKAVGVGSDYSGIEQIVTSPRKTTKFINIAGGGGWFADMVFSIKSGSTGGTVDAIIIRNISGGAEVEITNLISNSFVKTGATANEALLGDGTTKLLSEIGGTSVQDKDGIEQFTGTDIRFEGFDFDAVNDKIINPVTRAEVRASQYFAFGSNAGGSTDRTKLTLEQLTGSGANPMKWGIKGTPRSSSAGFISEIHQIVQYGTTDITVTEAHHDEFNVNQKLKAKEGLEVTGFLEPTNGNILQSKLVSGGGFKINQYQTSPYKITDLSSRNSANNTGWYNKIRVMLDFVDSTNTETFRYAIVELYQNNSSSEYIAEINATVKPTALDLSDISAYADDAAAATAGLAIGRGYINSSTGALHRRLT
jgi:hypothetical protein